MILKANLTFTLDGKTRTLQRFPVSLFGTYGIPWGEFDPDKSFGRDVAIQCLLLAEGARSTTVRATVGREIARNADQMTLAFHLAAEQKKEWEPLFRRFGRFPTSYVRKYPRIPADAFIQTFPLRSVIVSAILDPDNPEFEAVFDVVNLSPAGALLETQNPVAQSAHPGDIVSVNLEPRGWFPFPVHARALVCRVTDRLDPSSGNRIRGIGLRFTRMDEENKKIYLDLLKAILEDIRKKMANH